jgi:hypothetical protein
MPHWQPGMVAADNLSPQKAALLLTPAVTKTTNVDEIQRGIPRMNDRRVVSGTPSRLWLRAVLA